MAIGVITGLIGYATDHANGVKPHPTPVPRLLALIAAGAGTFARLLGAALTRVDLPQLRPPGLVYRFES